ncbi:MAG: chitobiase/beta-hexosaminidase C-terminal domain-containing protein, partial [Acetatifactor sp.]|nr:chitobiase/beta-hexosaminidase C-terminal domain-containing protein [Acetatifactor sp.]
IYYTTDKTEPTKESELYKEPILVTEAMTIKAIAVKEGCKDSAVVAFEYTLADSAMEQAKAPKATPGADTVSTRVAKGTEVRLSSVTTDAKIYYTTDGTIPTKASTLYEKAIVIEKDTVIKAIAVKEGFTDSAVATFTYKVLPDDVDYGDITPEDIEELLEKYEASTDTNKTLIPDGLWIAGLSSDGYIYTGSSIRPEVRVYNKNIMLREKADYTISYKNNLKANADVDVNADQKTLTRAKAPMVTVTGKGNYGGKEVAAFKILPIDISDDEAFEADEMSFDTVNKAKKQVPVLYWNGKSLKKKTDYVVAGYYKQKDITDTVGTLVESITEDGDYLVELEGKGNFTGKLKVEWHVDSSRKLISSATVKKIPDQEYTRGGAAPLPEVSFKGTDLILGSNYTVSYSNNEQPGVAYVIITGIGDYTGTKRVAFKVLGTPLKGAEVTGIEDRVYDGDEQEMDIDVLLNGEKLIEGDDYTVTYSSNVKVGKAVVTITGINAYSGVIKKNFRIKAYNVADELIKGTSDIKAKYMKGGAKPELHLTFEGMTLREGVDYSVTYQNNKVYPASAAKQPKLVIKGKGNFTGTKTVDFTIEAKTLEDVICVVPDVAKNSAGKYISKPVLTDVDGKKLAVNKDYEVVSYKAKDAELSASGAGLEVGDVITVELKGKGAYAGQSEAEAAYTVTYKVTEAGFSKANITIAPKPYTGKAVTLTKGDITVKVGGVELKEEDYEILPGSYINNVKKGTAQVTLVGQNGYGGAKTVKFKIGAHKFEWVWRLFSK